MPGCIGDLPSKKILELETLKAAHESDIRSKELRIEALHTSMDQSSQDILTTLKEVGEAEGAPQVVFINSWDVALLHQMVTLTQRHPQLKLRFKLGRVYKIDVETMNSALAGRDIDISTFENNEEYHLVGKTITVTKLNMHFPPP